MCVRARACVRALMSACCASLRPHHLTPALAQIIPSVLVVVVVVMCVRLCACARALMSACVCVCVCVCCRGAMGVVCLFALII